MTRAEADRLGPKPADHHLTCIQPSPNCRLAPACAILASNTSVIPIGRISTAEKAVDIIEIMGDEAATAAEARDMLGIKS
jgi:hypothetical protein